MRASPVPVQTDAAAGGGHEPGEARRDLPGHGNSVEGPGARSPVHDPPGRVAVAGDRVHGESNRLGGRPAGGGAGHDQREPVRSRRRGEEHGGADEPVPEIALGAPVLVGGLLRGRGPRRRARRGRGRRRRPPPERPATGGRDPAGWTARPPPGCRRRRRPAPPSGPAASSARRSGSPSTGTSPLATASPTVLRAGAVQRHEQRGAVGEPGRGARRDERRRRRPGGRAPRCRTARPGSARASRSRPSESRTCPCPSRHGMDARARSGATKMASPVASPHVKVARAARKAGRGSGVSGGGSGGASAAGAGGCPSAGAVGSGAVRRVACQVTAAAEARMTATTASAVHRRPGERSIVERGGASPG